MSRMFALLQTQSLMIQTISLNFNFSMVFVCLFVFFFILFIYRNLKYDSRTSPFRVKSVQFVFYNYINDFFFFGLQLLTMNHLFVCWFFFVVVFFKVVLIKLLITSFVLAFFCLFVCFHKNKHLQRTLTCIYVFSFILLHYSLNPRYPYIKLIFEV